MNKLLIEFMGGGDLWMCEADPGQLNNLASDPAFADVRAELAQRLQDYLNATNDPRIRGDVPWEAFPWDSNDWPRWTFAKPRRR